MKETDHKAGLEEPPEDDETNCPDDDYAPAGEGVGANEAGPRMEDSVGGSLAHDDGRTVEATVGKVRTRSSKAARGSKVAWSAAHCVFLPYR